MIVEGALAQALTAIDSLSDEGEYGFYSGVSGIAWSCIDAGTALASDALIARGRTAMRRAAGLPPKQQRLDIINGSAGFIPALLTEAKHDPDGQLIESAERHGLPAR